MRRRRRGRDAATSRPAHRHRSEATEPEAVVWFASSGPLARLPWACVGETVVGFLAAPQRFAVRQPNGLDVSIFRTQLAPLLLVCGDWKRLVQSLVQTYENQVHRVEFANSELPSSQIQQPTREGSDHVIQVQFVAQYPKLTSVPLMVPRSALRPDRLSQIDWSLVFSVFPCLVRLDLFDVCLSLVDKVLDAASVACPNVQVLVLSHKRSSTFAEFSTFERMTGHLDAALRVWHSRNGGLVGLCIPEWPSRPNGQYNELLSAVAAYCPRLEYLHGWHKRNPMGPLITRQLGNVEASVWRAFCENCSKLREFSWRLAPISAAFVEQFRQTKKPVLRDLRVEDTSIASDPADISSLETMFPALPGLRSVSLWMPNYCTFADQQCHARSGSLDTLLASVIRNCPQLESVRCFFPRSLERAGLISTETLVQLVDQSTVHEVVISPILLALDSLTKVLGSIVQSKRERFCKVELMAVGSVHEAIYGLLQFLEGDDKVLLSRLRFQLIVSSPDGDAASERGDDRSLVIEQDVADRIAKIKARYAGSVTRLTVTMEPVDSRPTSVFMGVELHINNAH